jgi:hypothetical protein
MAINDPVVYWTFDSGSPATNEGSGGSTYDGSSAGSNITGSVDGGQTVTDTDYASVAGVDLPFTGDHTVSIRVNHADQPDTFDERGIASLGWAGHSSGLADALFSLRSGNDGVVSATVRDSGGNLISCDSGATQVDDGSWHTISYRYTSASGLIELFVDGVERGQTDGAGSGVFDFFTIPDAAEIRVGGLDMTTDVDEFRVYNRALNDTEMGELHSFAAGGGVTNSGAMSSAGAGAASFVGASRRAGALSSAGIGAASFVGADAGGDSLTLTQVLSATSTASTITWPATLAAGDLAVMFDSGNSEGPPPTTVVPSGFTSIINTTDGSFGRMICSYKILTGSESGSLTGMNAADNRKAMVIFRGSRAIIRVTVADTAGQLGVGIDPAAQTVNASGQATPLIVFGAYASANNGTPIDPRTFTVGGAAAKDGEVNPNQYHYLAWKIYDTSPADVVVDQQNENGFDGLQSFYLQIAGATVSVLSAAGVGSASFSGTARVNSALSAAGAATASFVGSTRIAGALSSAGAATASFVGASQRAGAMSSAGVGALSAVGAAGASAALNASGAATVSFVGDAELSAEGALLSEGASTASFVGASTASAAMSSTGQAQFSASSPAEETVDPVDDSVVMLSGGGAGGGSYATVGYKDYKPRKPRIHVIKIGEWPELPEPANTPTHEDPYDLPEPEEFEDYEADAVDDDDDALDLILALVA